jgi:hypothetical protein
MPMKWDMENEQIVSTTYHTHTMTSGKTAIMIYRLSHLPIPINNSSLAVNRIYRGQEYLRALPDTLPTFSIVPL